MESDLELSSGFQPKHIFTLSDKFKQIAYIGMEELVFLVLVNTFWVRVAFFYIFKKCTDCTHVFQAARGLFKAMFLLGFTLNWVVVSNMFYFHPYLGNLTNIFQMG